MRNLPIVIFLVLLGMAGVTPAAELPVRKVVLYKHGVGYFERSGNIPAGETAQLLFKAGEMDDVLKSLTIVSQGAAVAGVRYESSEPLGKKLEDFPFRIGEAQPLSRILDQFKGSRVRLRMTGDEVEGTIISARTLPATEERPEQDRLVLLMDDGEIHTVDPGAAAALRLVDPKIQQQFKDYLSLVAGARNRDKRSVTIEASGEGARQIAARYVTPTPVWKSSYRLVFDGQDRPLLEGWAIVDNTSGEDWSDVTLSLVSGMPVSFVSHLYEPKYVQRPVAELRQDRAQRPIVHGGIVEEAQERVQAGQRGRAGRKMAAAMMAPSAPGKAERELSADSIGQLEDRPVSSSLAQTAATGELGELFEYRIDHPVTVRKSESAMLPFLQQRLDGRRLLIYNEGLGSEHPLNAVELTNSSGTTLDGGAITVFDGGAYAGEALFETIKDEDKRLISYAVELGTRITTAFDSSSKLQSEFTLRRGILTTRRAVKEVRTYTIHNVDPKPKTVVIERPARSGYEPVDTKPDEKTADSYRYEVEVDPGETKKFPVTEQRVVSQSVALTNLTYDQIVKYVQNKELDEAGRAKLEQVAELKRRIADTDRELESLEKQIQELFQDQERLRRNISSLRSVAGQSQQVQNYAQKLAAQEGELAGLRDRQTDLRRQRQDLQTELNDLIEKLEI